MIIQIALKTTKKGDKIMQFTCESSAIESASKKDREIAASVAQRYDGIISIKDYPSTLPPLIMLDLENSISKTLESYAKYEFAESGGSPGSANFYVRAIQ